MVNDFFKYYKEIIKRLELAADDSDIIDQRLRDNRVTHFLHFALYTDIRFEYTRIGQVNKEGRRVRHGNSGTRVGTCDLNRIPPSKHPAGEPLPQHTIIRYFDKSRTRQDWRSFYRRNYIAAFAWLDDETGEFTTDPVDLINSGQVPPPPLALSRGMERKVKKIIERLKRKAA